MERVVLSMWGSEEETVIITHKGIFLVQSPDLGDREYQKLSEVPDGFQHVDVVLLGLDIVDACPDEIF